MPTPKHTRPKHTSTQAHATHYDFTAELPAEGQWGNQPIGESQHQCWLFFMTKTPQHHNQLKDAFLENLSATGNVTAAAKDCGLGRSTAYLWRVNDAEFAARWEDALAMATDRLAYEARRRALDGIEEVRYFKGEPIGTIRRYSDQLLMFLLRAYRPDIYRQPKAAQQTSASERQKARNDLLQKMESVAGTNEPGGTPESDSKSEPDRN